MNSEKGVTFKIVWADEHMVEIEVTGSDGRFSGRTTFYSTPDFFVQLAKSLFGFPSSSNDVCRISLSDGRRTESELELRSDSRGLISIAVALMDCCVASSDFVNSVKFQFQTEPALLDRFVETLRQSTSKIGDEWHLAAV